MEEINITPPKAVSRPMERSDGSGHGDSGHGDAGLENEDGDEGDDDDQEQEEEEDGQSGRGQDESEAEGRHTLDTGQWPADGSHDVTLFNASTIKERALAMANRRQEK
ncbi:hypothetical protein PG988_006610 [Apiospora saccharicola]